MTQVNFHESQQCWAFNPRVVSQASRTTMPSRSRRSGRGPEAPSLAAGSTTIQDGERTLGASPCFHTKADVAQWIGANGRKWRAKLRSLPYVVLDNVITILGVPQSRHKGKRMHKEQLGELVCKTAAWMQKRGPPQSSERVPSPACKKTRRDAAEDADLHGGYAPHGVAEHNAERRRWTAEACGAKAASSRGSAEACGAKAPGSRWPRVQANSTTPSDLVGPRKPAAPKL